MASDNVKTGFRLPSEVKKDFSGIWYGSNNNNSNNNNIKKMSTFNNKIITNSSQEVFWNIHNKRPVLKSHFNKVLGLQSAALSKKRPRHRCFPVKLLRTRFLSNTSGRLLLEELKISLKTVPIAIPNDISKAYYEKGFSCSWTFAPSWALPKGVFRGGQKGIKPPFKC